MKTRIALGGTIIFLATLALVVTGLSLTLHPNSTFAGTPGPGLRGGHYKMMEALGLSEEQRQQVKEIFKENQPRIHPLIKQLLVEKRALRDLLQSDSVNEEAIRLQAKNVATVQADIAVQRAQIYKAVQGVLNHEQIKKFKELQEERDQRLDEFFSTRFNQSN